jgi:hypothetical protein
VEPSNWRTLFVYDVHDNFLTGEELIIIHWIAMMTIFSGTIPAAISNISTLSAFYVLGNFITGDENHYYYHCNRTKLMQSFDEGSGVLEHFIRPDSYLTYFSIAYNYISGMLVTPVYDIECAIIAVTIVLFPITGTIPNDISDLKYIKVFGVCYNFLTGTEY